MKTNQYCFMDAQRERRLEQVKKWAPMRISFFQKCYDGKVTPRQAIRAHCINCVGYGDKNLMLEVKECPATSCTLWQFRPYQGKKGELKDL